MGFKRSEVSKLLVQCHRRCCICHRFCGTKIETDHIIPKSENDSDEIENAIPVCFECHAEIHSYNVDHPRGRKFLPEELKEHKFQWLKICKEKPEIFVQAIRDTDVGPLQSLIDELDFNIVIASKKDSNLIGCVFSDKQFNRAIEVGIISILKEELKDSILEAYYAIGVANQFILSSFHHVEPTRGTMLTNAQKKIIEAEPKINNARDKLLEFLEKESSEIDDLKSNL